MLVGYPGVPKCHPERLHGREAGTGHALRGRRCADISEVWRCCLEGGRDVARTQGMPAATERERRVRGSLSSGFHHPPWCSTSRDGATPFSPSQGIIG